ncbi:zinc ribbon domain-containing protein [Megamonas funiformis]|uniref:zinc ribbon domain-containing protein n=1 Tax=Megamonas funiformis TaxID=437897 RepID=UPI002255E1B8|nr:zinc ribbon domain-containing protein [Megamonas funiformis]MCX4130357.1 zinc ribbon domain-containing protein [Megamonas funiformis]
MSKFCFKCGTPVNDGEKFCPKCGTNLGVSTSPQIQPNVNKNINSNNINNNNSNNNKMKIIIAIAIVVVIIVGSGLGYFLYQKHEKNTQVNTNTNTLVETAKATDDTYQQQKQDEENLKKANDILKNKNTNYKVSAVSTIDDNGFFGLMTGKGLRFIIYDKKDDMIATIPFDKELLNPKKYANTDRALYFNMSVEYDNVNSKDKKAGYWSGSTHTIPIEIYSEEKDGVLSPLGIMTYHGNNKGKYDEYLYEMQNVNLANLVILHGDSLRVDITNRNIDLP